MKITKLLLILFFIFFSSLIRVPAYSLEKVGMEHLIDNYKIIYSDQREDGIMSFILKKHVGYGADMMLCKIDNSELRPINMGCFPFPLAERD
tara:strand:- start:271 stop:546 length:276 start_codon:yes stop_codon:yes gene_type:complete